MHRFYNLQKLPYYDGFEYISTYCMQCVHVC